MSFLSMVYNLLMGPIEILFDVVYAVMYRITENKGLAIVALSLAINFLVLPLYRQADALQEEERVRTQKMQRGVDHIKKMFKGDERFMMLQTYYRQNDYKPYYALNGSLPLLLEIPFFIVAYRYLSGLEMLQGAPYGPIRDLGAPDGLLTVAGLSLNVLPIRMTLINIVSGVIYTKGMPLKSKIQLYGMALIFLVFLYDSPAGLVFYWTLNNLFSLVKNVFYKLKRPGFVLAVLGAVFSTAMLPYLFLHPLGTRRRQLFCVGALLCLYVPLGVSLLRRRSHKKFSLPEATAMDDVIFTLSGVVLAVLTGTLIPSAVIKASPLEFVNVMNLRSPLLYVLSASLYSFGAFVIWGTIFYRLTDRSVRKILAPVLAVTAACGVVDYMFFGDGYGNMSSSLQYDELFSNTKTVFAVNLALLLLAASAVVLLWRFRPALIRAVCAAGAVALLVMSVTNILSVHSEVEALRHSSMIAAIDDEVVLKLDKKEKNVVVLMMDRALGSLIPYIWAERPELKEQFAGFTYYPNTISYGNCTNVASPALFGGYDYTPLEIDRRADIPLVEKQNESLKVMPVNFLEAGYDVTVCDPSYAGYKWIPDVTIYDDYPAIRTYITNGHFSAKVINERTEKVRCRNFFAYGVFRAAPVIAHKSLYNEGYYNHQEDSSDEMLIQIIDGMYRAYGGFGRTPNSFTQAYDVLCNLPAVTRITDSGKGCFLMMSNDTTHAQFMLQEPDYVPSNRVDNTAYEADVITRTDDDGHVLHINAVTQMTHYQINAASFIRLGKWMDYLREQGVYDNTRIIIVSDHGKGLYHMTQEQFEETYPSKYSDVDDPMSYTPVLLVKDFNSREWKTDDTFMTNADTPTLAFQGVVPEPFNPFLKKPVTDEMKKRPEQYIGYTGTWETDINNGNVFADMVWLRLDGKDKSDMKAWHVLGTAHP